MTFNSVEFALFFLFVATCVTRLPRGQSRKVGLLLVSLFFYSLWNWKFSLLLILTAIIHWGAALVNHRWSMYGAVACSVAILSVFKYLGLWIDSIVMPVGISFYTFQAISYTVDVYKGRIEARKSPLDVALYVSFFPQLLSGPIVRADDFFQELEVYRSLSCERLSCGFGQFSFGLFKKVFIADRMAPFVGKVFEGCNAFDGITLWVAAISYTIQIYCDFSGYSDMAIGVARALGFDYKKNFDHPYLSTSVTEFWRRWHISLSTWLRDYVYIPLGGNRKGTFRQYLNQMITMLIGGAWHGADLSFVAWGGLHGAALCVHKWWRMKMRMPTALAWLVTMVVVIYGWVLFRAISFDQAWLFMKRMTSFAPGLSWLHPHVFIALAMVVLGSVKFKGRYLSERCDVRTPFGLFMALSAFLLAVVCPAGGANPFIYFNF